jgi:hypothetical protein
MYDRAMDLRLGSVVVDLFSPMNVSSNDIRNVRKLNGRDVRQNKMVPVNVWKYRRTRYENPSAGRVTRVPWLVQMASTDG